MHRIHFIERFLDRHKILLVILLVITISYAGINLLPNLVISYLIDNVISGIAVDGGLVDIIDQIVGGTDFVVENFWIIAVVLVVMYLLVAILMNLRQRFQGEIAETLCERIRNTLYSHIQLLPYAYHVKVKTGELLQKCTSDVDMIRRFFSGQFAEIFYIGATAITALIILVNLNSKLTIFVFISILLIFVYSYIFFKHVRKLFKLSDEEEAVLSTVIQESISGLRVVKAFGRELYEIEKFTAENERYKKITGNMIINSGYYWASTYCICLISVLIVISFGIIEVSRGGLSVGDLTVFISYQTTLSFSLRQLGRILSDFGKLTVSIDRLDDLLAQEAEDIEKGDRPDLKGDIVFSHVDFGYEDDDRQVLRDINITIKENETVAIIGPTGSGKSTLVALLARLYEPKNGTISINGHDIKNISKEYLRNNIGIVLQEPFLFSRSIMDNLRIVDESVLDEEVFKATKMAAVHDVISEFDKGYRTLVGEKGVTLSGGQKQRVAIARTLLKKAPIVIFDDSLSAVDTETDAEIRRAIRSFQGAMTCIIITQRTTSAKDCDHIIVIEEGRITQYGNHASLTKEEGLYKRIDEIQSKMLIEEEVR